MRRETQKNIWTATIVAMIICFCLLWYFFENKSHAHDLEVETDAERGYYLFATTWSGDSVVVLFGDSAQCELAKKGLERSGRYESRTFCVATTSRQRALRKRRTPN